MTMEPTAGAEAALSIDSIKEIMDGFDPASLLPQMQDLLRTTQAVCRCAILIGPLLLLALGIAYLFLAPKEANHYFGYRTYFGMGSVSAWQFTQRIAGAALGGLGLVLTLVMLFVSTTLSGLAPMDMVWKALRCLAWQAALTLIATAAINIVAAVTYDRKGNLRKKQAQ